MNETIRTILNRRSVRCFKEGQISDEELDLILKAGLYAPSAHNQQSWHFTVIQNRAVINRLNRAAKDELTKMPDVYLQKHGSDETFDLFYGAPTVIVIAGEKASIVPHVDCSAATQNILLAAESLNIGTCWIGLVSPLFKSKRAAEFLELFAVPEGFELYYAVAVGYKVQENEPAPPRRENTVNFIK